MLLAFVLCASSLMAQNKNVKGKITDDTGKPVPFATIKVKGTKGGVTADSTGNFSIDVREGGILIISSIGFFEQEFAVTGETASIQLSKSSQTVSEVVVTAFGIRRTDKGLGYSVAKVDPGSLTQKSEPDLLKSMQGKVAGVDIRSSQGVPGAATRIQIRGNTSFYGDNQPLIIVDGVPYSNDQVTTSSQTTGGSGYSSGLSTLDPNDIATMNVLKGSSAAALYGSRASNGVIIITTKSGSASRSKKGLEVTVKSGVSFEKIANLPDYQNDYGTGSYGNYSNSNGSWGPKFGTIDSIPIWPGYKDAYPDLFPSDSIAYRAYPDNVKNLFRTGKVIENSVGFSGGDDKSSVSMTLSQLSHSGYVQNSSYKRYNVGLGGSTKLAIGLNLRGNFSYSRSNQKGGYFGENQFDGAASMFARSLFLGRNWNYDLPFEDANGNMLVPGPAGQYDNPYWSAKYNVATSDEERFIAGGHFDFNVNSWFKVDYNLGTNVKTLSRREITEIGSRAAEGKGRLVTDDYRKQELQSDLLLTFTPRINNDFSLRASVGHSYNQRVDSRTANTGNQFITRGIYKLSNTAQQIFSLDNYHKRRIIGALADVTLSYKEYLFLNLTGRNDWSSTLPTNERSYFYPGASLGFVFTDALKLDKKVIDFGKVRVSWAKVGRDADPYSLQNTFELTSNFLGRPRGTRSTTAFDPELKPEFTKEVEIGTQLSFLKKRIDVDFAWYNRTSTNMIAPVAVPSTSGFSQYYTNFGGLRNRGVEITLTLRPVQTASFGWDIRGVFTKNTNIVTSLRPGIERMIATPDGTETGLDINPTLEVGMPYGYFRGSKAVRDADGNFLINPATGTLIESKTLGYLGNPNPDYKLGVTNSFTYKNFFCNILFDMTKGGDIYSVTVNSLLGRGVTKDTRDRETSFVIPGYYGDVDTETPLLGSDGKKIRNQTRLPVNDLYFASNANASTFAVNGAAEWSVYDATVYRLRELSLGYNFPKSLFKGTPIGSLTLSLTGRNLWYLAPNFPKYTNFDPEVNSYGSTNMQGFDLSAAPTTKRYGVNLLVTF
ncbi:TonB-linked outer membrane protein, SusC/RagA family [Filimonas lacunae]|uniref:TonB-linked outer membrane protein, SusC/RagA family n=2 Tax=Filimonas lacunae TaxID=477680 RepID=A0A1N7KH53_9BACT|nr:TonB-linked outer membrane protein, SusC/RagA family [Filimonas lacunae]